MVVVVPSAGDERRLRDGVASVREAARSIHAVVDIVVPEAATGAARNAALAASDAPIVVALDPGARIPRHALREVEHHLATNGCVGGAATTHTERRSLGIGLTMAVVHLAELTSGLGGGMYWARRTDIEAVGGFDERLEAGVGPDLARRLREHGRRTGRRFVTLRSVVVTMSCRDFDRYGDWHLIGRTRLPDAPAPRRAAPVAAIS